MLQKSWARHKGSYLDSYLISDVEDPRINIQSILTRHFLLAELFQNKYDEIMDHEIRFALTANWLLAMLKSSARPHEINQQTDDIFEGLTGERAGVDIPEFLSDSFKRLSFPNYIGDLLTWAIPADTDQLPEYLLNIFETIWAEILANETCDPVSVMEPACGSANEYRFFDSFRLSPFLCYTGFDLCDKNIRNANSRFPDVSFQPGNVFNIPAADKSVDYCFVHDLLEHLSPAGFERAINEMCRVTKKKICIHFFNMDDIDEHLIRKTNDYYWNRLSLTQIKQLLHPHAANIQVRHIDSILADQYRYPHHHNKYNYTWIVELD